MLTAVLCIMYHILSINQSFQSNFQLITLQQTRWQTVCDHFGQGFNPPVILSCLMDENRPSIICTWVLFGTVNMQGSHYPSPILPCWADNLNNQRGFKVQQADNDTSPPLHPCRLTNVFVGGFGQAESTAAAAGLLNIHRSLWLWANIVTLYYLWQHAVNNLFFHLHLLCI